MLYFDGLNPYHIPKEYLNYAYYALLFCFWAWLLHGVVKNFLEARRNFREAREIRRQRKLLEEQAMLERIAEIARRNKELREKWGFRDPVIVTQRVAKECQKRAVGRHNPKRRPRNH